MSATRPDIPSHTSNADGGVSQASDAVQQLQVIAYDPITVDGHKRLDQAVMESEILTYMLDNQIIIPGQSLTAESPKYVLCSICKTGVQEGLLDLAVGDAQRLLAQYPELGEMVDRAWVNGAGFKDIRCLRLLRPNIPDDIFNLQGNQGETLYEASVKATEDSWNYEFIGSAHVALKAHILYHRETITNPYAPYCAIVQSTGTGKSKVVDEFSKTHFVIPVNLRKPGAGGFPPSDEEVHKFLNVGFLMTLPPPYVWIRMNAFIFALLEECEKVIDEAMNRRAVGHTWLRSEGAAWFREMMTQGQTMHAQGQYRVNFYNKVVRRATKLYGDVISSPLISGSSTTTASTTVPQPTESSRRGPSPDLIRFASPGDPSVVDKSESLISRWKYRQSKTQKEPVVYLAFDEAHFLTTPDEQAAGPKVASPFSHLRKILRSFRDLPLFAMLLSTTGKVTQFNTPKEDDDSTRLQDGTLVVIPPFFALGWDQRAAPLDEPMTLTYVSAPPYKARLGRPLFASRYASGELLHGQERKQLHEHLAEFAAQKLIRRNLSYWPSSLDLDQELACLSARIPIEFMSSVHTPATKAEKDQIANHMRICLSVDPSFRKFTSLNPSEPIVSEGAYLLMTDSRTKFHAPLALSRVLTGFSIYQGDRGEFVALLAIIMARDRVVKTQGVLDSVFGVVPFMNALIARPARPTDRFADVLAMKPSVYQNPNDKETCFENAFADVHLHFNHVVKRQVQKVNMGVFRGLIARCAAFMCANGQAGFDIGVPTVQGIGIVNDETQGMALLQIKNDPRFTEEVVPELFDRMDPVTLKLIDADTTLKTPIIRIVFALAANTPAVRCVETQKLANFTSYDIWVAGLSPDVLAVIDRKDQEIWDELLSASKGWENMYKHPDPTTHKLMQNMAPMLGDTAEFWKFGLPKAEVGPN